MLVRGNSNSSASRDPQQLISQSVQHLIEQLKKGKSEALTSYLCAMARFHKYSFGNVLLIATQRPDATRVAGFHTGTDLGGMSKRAKREFKFLRRSFATNAATTRTTARSAANLFPTVSAPCTFST